MALNVVRSMIEALVVQRLGLLGQVRVPPLIAQPMSRRCQVVVTVSVAGIIVDHLLKPLHRRGVLPLLVQLSANRILPTGRKTTSAGNWYQHQHGESESNLPGSPSPSADSRLGGSTPDVEHDGA